MKNQIFEYFIFKSLVHLRDKNRNNDLSVLKCMKLLFFFSTVNDDKNDSLIDQFDQVYAMPLGHVETDIYTAMKNNSFTFFSFTNRDTVLKHSSIYTNNFESQIIELVDPKFDLLLEKNPNIFSLSAYELVELSHKWFSWRYYFAQAKAESKSKMKIPIEVIKNEYKVYSF
ncbi:hypothetical protein FAZ19_07230 [Sphingobacterium alkalisoli]|uniref:DUF4065 domain-containing protein n=1 Tax=Sphingobacterium alkalisoli TaxID=1874115 RepID=A0A4U0H4Q8_9SPHI|nr:hypothetical protein [Sphingobacterium alkalisoli]TJY66703.1 hypothetical protein FAZ19_07230 [Sphingobacterium alkalisoli]GGH14710.1 hypothetical protein GCM10011418_15860 [Sphingobacterium alkalisoli]